MKRVMLLVLVALCATCMYCQNKDSLSLSDEELESKIQIMARERIDQFNDYLAIISSSHNSGNEVKEKYISQALKLFLGNGEDYWDAETGSIVKSPIVEVVENNKSTGSVRKMTRPVKTWLNMLKNLKYSNIKIVSFYYYYVSDIKVLSEDTYEVTMIQRKFDPLTKSTCTGNTYKKIRFISDKKQKTALGDNVTKWYVWLGDIMINVL